MDLGCFENNATNGIQDILPDSEPSLPTQVTFSSSTRATPSPTIIKAEEKWILHSHFDKEIDAIHNQTLELYNYLAMLVAICSAPLSWSVVVLD